MGITELAVLKWLHIFSMVYWLGGEWVLILLWVLGIGW